MTTQIDHRDGEKVKRSNRISLCRHHATCPSFKKVNRPRSAVFTGVVSVYMHACAHVIRHVCMVHVTTLSGMAEAYLEISIILLIVGISETKF